MAHCRLDRCLALRLLFRLSDLGFDPVPRSCVSFGSVLRGSRLRSGGNALRRGDARMGVRCCATPRCIRETLVQERAEQIAGADSGQRHAGCFLLRQAYGGQVRTRRAAALRGSALVVRPMRLLGIALVGFATCLSCIGNPTLVGDGPDYLGVLVGEHVSVSAGADKAVVRGVYRFRFVRNSTNVIAPHRASLSVPVLVPNEGDVEVAKPEVTVDGNAVEPKRSSIWRSPVPGMRMVVFVYEAKGFSLRRESVVNIRYDQPYSADGIVYYVPFLPDHEKWRRRFHFEDSDFVIQFEGANGVELASVSAGPDSPDPHRAMIARDGLPIGVRVTRPNNSPEATPGRRPPAGPNPSSGAPRL